VPELPEVETTRRGIAPYVTQQTLTGFEVRERRLRWPIPPEFESTLLGQKVSHVTRRSKYLLIHCEQFYVIIHLGMSGSLRIIQDATPPEKHDHVDIMLSNGYRLRYNDPRRFGAILYSTGDPCQHKLLKQLGPEPLEQDFTGDHLFALSRKKKVPVKSFIMDAHNVVGVGNIYANESLFNAGIDPRRQAGSISRNRYQRLAQEIKTVLSTAIEKGGTTLKDFVGGDGKPGYFQQELKVYGQSGKPCVKCQRTLKEIRISKRSTVFCSRCQS